MFHDGDDVGQGVESPRTVSALKLFRIEAVFAQTLFQFLHDGWTPILGLLEQDTQRSDFVRVGFDEFFKRVEVILGGIEFAVTLQLLGSDDILFLYGSDEGALRPGIIEQKLLKLGI